MYAGSEEARKFIEEQLDPLWPEIRKEIAAHVEEYDIGYSGGILGCVFRAEDTFRALKRRMYRVNLEKDFAYIAAQAVMGIIMERGKWPELSAPDSVRRHKELTEELIMAERHLEYIRNLRRSYSERITGLKKIGKARKMVRKTDIRPEDLIRTSPLVGAGE